MAYIDDHSLSQSPEFQNRITIAIVQTVRAIVLEADTTPNHVMREGWAGRAILDPTAMMHRMKWGVVIHPTVRTNGAAITDTDLQTVVDGLVNPFSRLV